MIGFLVSCNLQLKKIPEKKSTTSTTFQHGFLQNVSDKFINY